MSVSANGVTTSEFFVPDFVIVENVAVGFRSRALHPIAIGAAGFTTEIDFIVSDDTITAVFVARVLLRLSAFLVSSINPRVLRQESIATMAAVHAVGAVDAVGGVGGGRGSGFVLQVAFVKSGKTAAIHDRKMTQEEDSQTCRQQPDRAV